MKCIVVEIKNKNAVVLSDNGSIIKVKNDNYQIGEEIQMKRSIVKKSKIKIVAVAAGLIVFLTGASGVYAYNKPYAYVSLDVNPSIEYTVNALDRVIDVNAVNDDGQEIINNIDVENKTIDEAIKNTVSEIAEQGYITEEAGGIVISTSSEDEKNASDAEKLADELKTDAEKTLEENNLNAEVEALSVGRERVLEARELGVTPGKLNLVEKLQKSAANPDDISIEEWLNKPVKDIMKATKANKEEQRVKTEGTATNTEDQEQQGESEATQSELTNSTNSMNSVKEKNENKEVKEKVNKNKETSTTPAKENVNKAEEKKSENKSQGSQGNTEKGNNKENKKDK
ncbi:anti-sigma factor domain-containing protein [Clostridium cibarium]|uniref:Anti-sigma factor domain-containing protein n=1 Tax=Clostridium cibarium TaxID=2762247 RepID=A0ABR8PQ29_9CLOT|nr:anti-sigma factor domain-containing protein [Clostridium cibarium]MBD7910280.1 anti-sigma factor domain-containing protein [Clostridium cibarium]